MEFSSIIPCYNDIKSLQEGFTYLNENNFFKEHNIDLIIVDDGSDYPDETESFAQAHNAQFIGNTENTGKGYSIKRGIMAAKCEYTIFTDADIPFALDDIIRVLQDLVEKKKDLVLGHRSHNDSYYNKVGKLRSLGSKLFNYITSITLNLGDYDNQCGLKGFNTKSIRKISEKSFIDRYCFDAELIYLAKKNSLNISTCNVELRKHDKSSLSFYLDGISMLYDLIRIRFHRYD